MEDDRVDLEYREDPVVTMSASSNSHDGAESMALNESTIQNVFDDSGFRTTSNSMTMQMQRPIVNLSSNFITPEQAEEFYEQALRSPDLKINQCMGNNTIELLNIKVLTDANFTLLSKTERPNWKNLLNIIKVASLIVQYG